MTTHTAPEETAGEPDPAADPTSPGPVGEATAEMTADAPGDVRADVPAGGPPAPDPLFGSGIKYDFGYSRHDEEILKATIPEVLRSLPHLVAVCVRLSWRADRLVTFSLIASQLTLGAVTAFGLLATNGVLRAMLAQGPTPERIRAALPAIILVCVAGSLTSVLGALSTRAEGILQSKVQAIATTELLEKSVRVELLEFQQADYHNVLDAGQWGATWTSPLLTYLVYAVNAVMSLVAVGGVLGILHPALLPLLPLVALPRATSAILRVRRHNVSRHAWLARTRQQRELVEWLTEKKSATEIRAHEAGTFLLPHYRRLATAFQNEQTRLAKVDARAELFADTFYGLSVAATYGLLAFLLWHGIVPLSTAGTAAYAVKVGTSQIGMLVRMCTYVFEYGMYLSDWQKACRLSETKAISSDGPEVASPQEIRAENLTFTYPGTTEPALTDVELTIRRGEIIALVGANGSGKSTLAALLAGLYLPDTGHVTWDGRPTSGLDRWALFDQVSILAQDYPRWPFTFSANVAIGRHRFEPTPEALLTAAVAGGADELIAKFPDGWNTLLALDQLGGVDVSGGQWQKVALARVFFRDAPVLVLDEPTAALDPQAEADTFQRVSELAGGRTVVLITHRLASVRNADRIYVLDHGRITESGTHAELLASGREYSRLFRMQASQYGIVAES